MCLTALQRSDAATGRSTRISVSPQGQGADRGDVLNASAVHRDGCQAWYEHEWFRTSSRMQDCLLSTFFDCRVRLPYGRLSPSKFPYSSFFLVDRCRRVGLCRSRQCMGSPLQLPAIRGASARSVFSGSRRGQPASHRGAASGGRTHPAPAGWRASAETRATLPLRKVHLPDRGRLGGRSVAGLEMQTAVRPLACQTQVNHSTRSVLVERTSRLQVLMRLACSEVAPA